MFFLQTRSFCLLQMLTDGLEFCGLLWGFYQLTLTLTAPIHCRAALFIFHFWVNYSFNGLAFCNPTFLSEDIIDIGQKLWFHLSDIIGQAMDAMHMVTALCFFLWKNEWMHLYSAWLCIVVHPKGGGGGCFIKHAVKRTVDSTGFYSLIYLRWCWVQFGTSPSLQCLDVRAEISRRLLPVVPQHRFSGQIQTLSVGLDEVDRCEQTWK